MVDAKAGASLGPNLGVIPDNFHLTYGGGPQIIHVDTAVTRTGKPSIRLDQHTASDVNIWRECDGTWYQVKPGDRIVAKCWILVDKVTVDSNIYDGARLGIDFYAPTGTGKIQIVDSYPHDGAEHAASEVHWGTVGWVQKTWDLIIPNTIFTKDVFGNAIPRTPITHFVLWLDVRPVDAGLAWFADAELYINPIAVPPPAAAYMLTVVGSSGGTTSLPPGLYTYTAVTDVPVQAIPSQGYKFSKWFLDGVDQTPWWPTAQFTVWKMAANHTLQAVFTALPPPTSNVRIAVSSVTASSDDGYYVPNMAIDGIENPSNYWGTDAKVPQGRVPQWLKLDLGSVHRINTVTTHFYDGSVRTYTYYLEVSNDSSSWTTIVSTKTGRGSVTDMFSQVGARFVRITITANTANPAAHIEEIKVYGFS